MKNYNPPRLIALIFLASYFLLSCQHVIPISCDDINFTMTVTHADATSNQANGTISITSTGGSDFSYSLNGAQAIDTGYFSNLQPGNYTIIGQNSNGCADTSLVTIGGSINPCLGINISVNASATNATIGQNNGSITATASPAGSYTYSIDGINFQSVGVFPNLAAGSYSITAKNSNGCVGVSSQVIVGTTNPCTGITVNVSTTQSNPTTGQSNGIITATATGGNGFTYSLNGGAFQSSGTFNNLATGNYTIIAQNSNGCTGSTTVALGSTNPCTGVVITVSTNQVNPTTGQTNGSITASATPAGTYTYSINGTTFQATGNFANLAAGTYTITAKNANGCLGTVQATLVASNPCTGITINIAPTVVNVLPCPNTLGSITLTATGSTGFTYNKNGGAYQANNVFSSLTAGNYTIGVKDVNGCTSSQVISVGTAVMGPNFTNVRNIIQSNCGGCHLNGGNDGGYNFDNNCSIVTKWSQIKGACVSPYTLRRMPPSGGGLSSTLQAQITAWVNAGHRYTD
jgi:hypothetical protein